MPSWDIQLQRHPHIGGSDSAVGFNQRRRLQDKSVNLDSSSHGSPLINRNTDNSHYYARLSPPKTPKYAGVADAPVQQSKLLSSFHVKVKTEPKMDEDIEIVFQSPCKENQPTPHASVVIPQKCNARGFVNGTKNKRMDMVTERPRKENINTAQLVCCQSVCSPKRRRTSANTDLEVVMLTPPSEMLTPFLVISHPSPEAGIRRPVHGRTRRPKWTPQMNKIDKYFVKTEQALANDKSSLSIQQINNGSSNTSLPAKSDSPLVKHLKSLLVMSPPPVVSQPVRDLLCTPNKLTSLMQQDIKSYDKSSVQSCMDTPKSSRVSRKPRSAMVGKTFKANGNVLPRSLIKEFKNAGDSNKNSPYVSDSSFQTSSPLFCSQPSSDQTPSTQVCVRNCDKACSLNCADTPKASRVHHKQEFASRNLTKEFESTCESSKHVSKTYTNGINDYEKLLDVTALFSPQVESVNNADIGENSTANRLQFLNSIIPKNILKTCVVLDDTENKDFKIQSVNDCQSELTITKKNHHSVESAREQSKNQDDRILIYSDTEKLTKLCGYNSNETVTDSGTGKITELHKNHCGVFNVDSDVKNLMESLEVNSDGFVTENVGKDITELSKSICDVSNVCIDVEVSTLLDHTVICGINDYLSVGRIEEVGTVEGNLEKDVSCNCLKICDWGVCEGITEEPKSNLSVPASEMSSMTVGNYTADYNPSISSKDLSTVLRSDPVLCLASTTGRKSSSLVVQKLSCQSLLEKKILSQSINKLSAKVENAACIKTSSCKDIAVTRDPEQLLQTIQLKTGTETVQDILLSISKQEYGDPYVHQGANHACCHTTKLRKITEAESVVLTTASWTNLWSLHTDYLRNLLMCNYAVDASVMAALLDVILNTPDYNEMIEVADVFKDIIQGQPPCHSYFRKQYMLIVSGQAPSLKDAGSCTSGQPQTGNPRTPVEQGDLSLCGVLESLHIELCDPVLSNRGCQGKQKEECDNVNEEREPQEEGERATLQPLRWHGISQFKASERVEHLMTALRLMIDVLEHDLRSYDNTVGPTETPLLVEVLWGKPDVTGLNEKLQHLVEVYALGLGTGWVDVTEIERLIRLTAKVIYASEQQAKDYFSTRLGQTFADAISKTLASKVPQLYVQAVLQLELPRLAVQVIHAHLCVLMEKFEPPSVELVHKCLEQYKQQSVQPKTPIRFNKLQIYTNKVTSSEDEKSRSKLTSWRNKKGESLLHTYCRGNHVEKLRDALLVPGVDVNLADNNGWTPLHDAIAYERVECVEELLLHGVNVQAKNCDGITPLMKAAIVDSEEICQLLLNYGGADLLQDRDSDGRRPIDHAESNAVQRILYSMELGCAAVLPAFLAQYLQASHFWDVLPRFAQLGVQPTSQLEMDVPICIETFHADLLALFRLNNFAEKQPDIVDQLGLCSVLRHVMARISEKIAKL